MATTTISSGVTSSGLTISGNNTIIVASGGTASSFTAIAGTLQSNGISVQAGGTVVSAVLSSGGNLNEAGGVDRFTQILAGGFEVVSSGGVASNTVMSGGTFRVAQGGTAVSASILFNTIGVVRGSGGQSGVMSSTTISSGGEIIVSSGGIASGSVVLSGGFEIVVSGGNAFGADVTSGGTQVVSSGGTATNTTIENGGSLALRGLAFSAGGSASFNSGTGVLTVVEGGNTYTETLAGSYTGLFFHTAVGVSSSTLVTVDTNPACFCAGTLLQTEDGAVAVEDLAVGTALRTVLGAPSRRVRWIGHRDTYLARNPRPWDVQAVRVLAGALAPGIPAQEVRLSPDHAVFLQGHLIPVRSLINGATIVQERRNRVSYYHVELADAEGQAVHDVLLAHGLPVESYLDTGNRSAFANGGPVVMAHPDFARRTWDERACAPLAVEGAVVRDVRHGLLARAVAMGFTLTEESDLCLVADECVLRPSEASGETIRFSLARPASSLALLSRVFVPAEADPDSSDRRRLGVAVRSVTIDGVSVDLAALDDGWHAAEPGWRWTEGEAGLPGSARSEIVVRLWSGGRYWMPVETRAGEQGAARG